MGALLIGSCCRSSAHVTYDVISKIKTKYVVSRTHRLSAYAWQQGRLLPEGGFDNNEAGLQQFSDYLAAPPKDRLCAARQRRRGRGMPMKPSSCAAPTARR